MARNGSGVYTAPVGTAAVSGQAISSTAYNAFVSDLETEITGSLPVDGDAPMTGVLRGSTGSAAAPSFTFSALTTAGLYKTSAGIGMSVGGTLRAELLSTGMQMSVAPVPATSDLVALGSATLMWSDLFLASGAVLNFNNGNLTMTHSAAAMSVTGTWTFTGAVAANSLTLTTKLAVAQGGTGSSTADTARLALGVGAPDIFIEDQQTSGTTGGTFTSGADRIRVLNTEVRDVRSECSLASNQFTLTAGTYWIEARVPAYRVDLHQSFLYNATGATELLRGTPEHSDAAGGTQTTSTVSGSFTIAAAQALEIRHRCSTTGTTTGLGRAASFGTERFAQVRLWRLA